MTYLKHCICIRGLKVSQESTDRMQVETAQRASESTWREGAKVQVVVFWTQCHRGRLQRDRQIQPRQRPAKCYSSVGGRMQHRVRETSVHVIGSEIHTFFFLLLTLIKALILILFIIINFGNWPKYLNEVKWKDLRVYWSLIKPQKNNLQRLRKLRWPNL